MLWLISLIEISEPHDISFVKNSAENGNGNIWLVTQDEQSSQIMELTDCKQIEHMTILYGDWWTVNAWFYGGKECGLDEWTFELP